MISTWPNGFSLHEGLIIIRPSIPVLVAKETRKEAMSQGPTSPYKKWRFQMGNKIKFETVKFIFALS